jgi:hypothetical protein
MRNEGATNSSLLVKFIFPRSGVDGIPVFSPPQRILGAAPETTGGRTVPVVAIIRFLAVLGRTRPNGEITNLRLFGTAGITVKVCQPAHAGSPASSQSSDLERSGAMKVPERRKGGAVRGPGKTGME